MILRSGKVLVKRPYHPSANTDEIKEDIISRLPDALLIQILSLLPEADVKRIRMVSKRWMHLWAFLPNLSFFMPYACSIEKLNKFYASVDQILALRREMPIQRFLLECNANCNYIRVYDVLCSAVQCKVQELHLTFPDDRFRVRFCWDLFRTCNTLVKLSLRGEFMLDVPEAELLFPCLKELNLLSIAYAGEKALSNLISGSPVLEKLLVVRYDEFDTCDNLKTCNISSTSLKRLNIYFTWCECDTSNYKVVIDAPKLEYIHVMDLMSSDYSLTEPLSLVEAHINQTKSVSQLVTFLSYTKILTLTYSAMAGLSHAQGLNMPMFPHLVKLVIGIDCLCGWNLLPVLLNNMPNLEHITFTDWLRVPHFLNMIWSPPVDPPACLRFKIKEVTIRHRKAVTQEEFTFIKYLLKHSNKLVTFTINARTIDPEMREQLVNFHHSSDLCRFEFV